MKRQAGVLLSITSLPSKYGIGCFDQAAYDFVDWLEKAGQKYWQILPLGSTSHHGAFDSPYQAYSAFAGNPYFISLDALVEEGVLTREECDSAAFGENPAKVDYALLFTFVCFFIFSGNLAAIPAVRDLLTSLMDKSAFFASLAASQVISNVPSALLLSPFTDNAAAMILGTDVGGLGTIVASLASLISYKFYANSAGANSGKYLLYFTVVNVILLLPLIGLAMVML